MNEIVEAKQPQVPSALQHGILSKHLLLQSEDPSEYAALLEALRQEYAPESVTEQHLVEELAGIMWRKRRLRIGEAAHYRRILKNDDTYNNATAEAAMVYVDTDVNVKRFSTKKALATSDEANKKELEGITGYSEPAVKAVAMLEKGDSYEDALAALAEGTREWWQEDALRKESMSGRLIYQPNVECLHRFLTSEVIPEYKREYVEVRHRALVKQQAEGEAFIPDDRLEKFARYEVHLDRKFERTLTVLIRLQDMRKGKTQAPAEDEVA